MAPIITEHVFKHVDGIDILADVVLPSGASADSPLPVVLWWHGGGLLQGTRKGVWPAAGC